MNPSAASNAKAKEVVMAIVFQPILEEMMKGPSDDPKRSVFGDDAVLNIIAGKLATGFAKLG